MVKPTTPIHIHRDGEIHLGCKGSHKHSSGFFGKYKEFILSISTGILWIIGFISNKLNYSELSTILLLIAYITGGYEAFIDSIRATLQKRFTIESLMIFAAIGAGLLGKLNEGVLLLFLFGLGHALEHFSLEKAKKSIKALTDISPKKALIKNLDGTEQEVLVEQLQINQTFIVKPGQLIACDGIIKSGSSTIDESAITGESVPVTKNIGNEVFAGTVNGDGLITIKITKLITDTMLAKIIRLVTEADTQKSKTQKFAEKFEKIFVPVVLVSILLIALLPPFLGLMTYKASIYMAIIILVSASPCALALATPVAVLIGISRATSLGVLIKGGAALENLGLVNAIAFDKTGTLTIGKPSVTKIYVIGNNSEELALSLAYGIELGSAHPLAHAITEYANTNNITPKLITQITNISGKGITGIYENKMVKLGSYKLFDNISDEINTYITELDSNGATSMILTLDNQFIAVIGLKDTIRNDIANTLAELKSLGVQHNVMLTGDKKEVAKTIGQEIGIDEIHAELLPEDKLTQIKQLTSNYTHVAMVGDGVNDAPAMANATIGIAMGDTKTDVAIETSDVVLMNDRINQLPNAILISKQVRKIIKQNLFISLGVVAGLVIAGLMSYTNIIIAVGIHEGSTLVVIFNALRLMYTVGSTHSRK